jgi:hypothetical protein
VILLVPAPGVTSDSLGYYARVHEQFDDQDVFTFHTPAGQTVRAKSYVRDLALGNPVNGDDTPVSFVVAADTTSGTVTMDLAQAQLTEEVGPSSIQQPSDQRKNISWTKNPTQLTLTVSFPS